MKLDIVCGGFATEMSDYQLEAVYGGGGAPLGLGVGGGLGAGGALSASAASSTNIHSFAGLCDINVFTVNVITGTVKSLLNIANCNTQTCASND